MYKSCGWAVGGGLMDWFSGWRPFVLGGARHPGAPMRIINAGSPESQRRREFQRRRREEGQGGLCTTFAASQMLPDGASASRLPIPFNVLQCICQHVTPSSLDFSDAGVLPPRPFTSDAGL